MQTNPAVEQNKNPWNQSGRKGKGLWRKSFAKEPRLGNCLYHFAKWPAIMPTQPGHPSVGKYREYL